MIYIGIDPGKNGGIAVIATGYAPGETLPVIRGNFFQPWRPIPGGSVFVIPMPDNEVDLVSFLGSWLNCRCCLEEFQMRRGEGTVSGYTSAKNWGFLKGVLAALRMPHEVVPVRTWQKVMMPGKPSPPDRLRELRKQNNPGVKKELQRLANEHKANIKAFAAERAAALFPGLDLRRTPKCKGPHDGMVDALLIAEYNRRVG